MTCCIPIIQGFNNATVTSVPYGVDKQLSNGSKPFVQVIYFMDDGTFDISHNSSAVKFVGNTVVVDHGGAMTGFVSVR